MSGFPAFSCAVIAGYGYAPLSIRQTRPQWLISSLFSKPTTYDSIVGCVNQFELLMHNLSIALDASLRMFSDQVNGGRKG